MYVSSDHLQLQKNMFPLIKNINQAKFFKWFGTGQIQSIFIKSYGQHIKDLHLFLDHIEKAKFPLLISMDFYIAFCELHHMQLYWKGNYLSRLQIPSIWRSAEMNQG